MGGDMSIEETITELKMGLAELQAMVAEHKALSQYERRVLREYGKLNARSIESLQEELISWKKKVREGMK
jgi:hypothetical protein